MKPRRRSVVSNLAGTVADGATAVKDAVIFRPPWEIIALAGLAIATLANIMFFMQRKKAGGM